MKSTVIDYTGRPVAYGRWFSDVKAVSGKRYDGVVLEFSDEPTPTPVSVRLVVYGSRKTADVGTSIQSLKDEFTCIVQYSDGADVEVPTVLMTTGSVQKGSNTLTFAYGSLTAEYVLYGTNYQLVKLTDVGAENARILNSALATGDVMLEKGVYPVYGGITIDGHALDLGESELQFDGYYDFVTMKGNAPTLTNGTISGNYQYAPGEDGYVPLEDPTSPLGYVIAVGIRLDDGADFCAEGITMSNIPGYAMTSGSHGLRQFSPASAPADNKVRFQLHGYSMLTARHAVQHNYYISSKPVLYEFSNGEYVSATPGEYVNVPNGATYVDVTTYGTYLQYGLFESNYNHNATIRDCIFRCNQRLAIANLAGVSLIENCVSYSNGFPREDHTGIHWDSSTSGFIDVEDVQTPYLTVRNCDSTNENLGIASRAYELLVYDCPTVDVRPYAGWSVYANGCKSLTYNGADAAFSVDVHTDDTPVTNTILLDSVSRVLKRIDDLPVLPVNGSSYISCTITNKNGMTLWYGNNAVGGNYDRCDITLDGRWITAYARLELVFENCNIKSNGNKLLNQLSNSGAKITFRNCTVDTDYANLFDTTPCPVEIIVE